MSEKTEQNREKQGKNRESERFFCELD